MFTEAEAAEELGEATKTLELCNEMARWQPRAHSSHTLLSTLVRSCPMHTCQAIMINAVGAQKTRIFGQHQDATVADYAKTFARFRAFLKKSGVDVMDAIIEELDGAEECVATKFLLHEAAHNIKSVSSLYS